MCSYIFRNNNSSLCNNGFHGSLSWSAIYFFLPRSFSSPCSVFSFVFCMINLLFACPFSSCCDPDSCPLLFPHVCVFVSVVLTVCQMYPGLQISHVEEASSPATIPGWCKKGWGHCQTRSFIVVPYRCLGESKIHPEQIIILQRYNIDQI